jgi:CheY-like chemotaxis protein/CHASE3 domain sensor protein
MMNLNRKIRIGLGFSLVLLVFASVVSYYCIQKLIDKSQWIDHTNEILTKVEHILYSVSDLESAVRGYAVSDDPVFLNTFEANKRNLYFVLNDLKTLTQDNPSQRIRIDTLGTLIDQKLRILDIAVSLNMNYPDANLAHVFRDGKSAMDKIRSLTNHIKKEEQRLLAERTREVQTFSSTTPAIILISSIISILIAILSYLYINRDLHARAQAQNELEQLNAQLNESNAALTENKTALFNRNYILSSLSELNKSIRNESEMGLLGFQILKHLCGFMKAQAGVIYIKQDGIFKLAAGYAMANNAMEKLPGAFKQGEGIAGQVAIDMEMLVLGDLPPGSIRIESGVALVEPANILYMPFCFKEETIAVAEIISKDRFEDIGLEYIKSAADNIATTINRLKAEIKTMVLLEETQAQSEELTTQQEELRHVNQELREQRNRLEASEEELKANEEELHEKNAELEEKANELEEQYEALSIKNNELENIRDTIKLQMEQLQTVNKYKSEFLANMSHELRTPLNSILILSKLLKDNNAHNLNPKQVEHAGVIERSGNDLLRLINEILDLARIESGKIRLETQDVDLHDLEVESLFRETAVQKKITFNSTYEADIPQVIRTDKFRLEQVLKNLLSNAFKFTPEGGKVTFAVFSPPDDHKFSNEHLRKGTVIGFRITDTGIGIPEDKQQLVFEAFQQVDSSTTRKFGGTGLGLSISRELAALLGGEIHLQSKENEGSVFTLYLPLQREDIPHQEGIKELPVKQKINLPVAKATVSAVADRKTEKSILVIDDDEYFRKMIVDYARKRKYKVYASGKGEEGLRLASENIPDAILLDLKLPDISGWEVLGRIKNADKLKNIPVHLMSASDKEDIKDLGQSEFIAKPVSLDMLDKAFNEISREIQRPVQKVLIIEDNEVENKAVAELLASQEIASDAAYNGAQAIRMLEADGYDCVILDIYLPDVSGFELLKQIKAMKTYASIPVIIYSGKDLSEVEEASFKKYTKTIIIKTEYSYTRLLEEVKLFLHNIQQSFGKKDSYSYALNKNHEILKGRKVLVVDDDIRNIYSLNNVLEEEGMKTIVAYDGKQALQELENNKDTDIILMDMMMPEMDGIEATKRIKSDPALKDIPILALTAKAMKGDKEKCLEAGASDYISKPVDVDKLFSLMRVWLYNRSNKLS